MKYTIAIMVFCVCLLSCSKPEVNNDPVLGVWYNAVDTTVEKSPAEEAVEEWTFNDAYYGRYHLYENGSVVFKTDFMWSYKDGVYSLTYHSEDMNNVNFKKEASILYEVDGEVMAVREE